MNSTQIKYLMHHLKANGVSFDAGLTTEEVQQVERTFNFRFPPDLRAFLQTALPASKGFVPWRYGIGNTAVAHSILERMHCPVNKLVVDAREGVFWLPQWGPLPVAKWERETVARQYLADCPQLIPIYSHRYLPEMPCETGNPVFSVWGSDIVYYGYDLFSYFVQEFTLHNPPDSKFIQEFTLHNLPNSKVPTRPKHIAFWSDFDEPQDIDTGGYWDGKDESH
ncbi:MAG: SMI1/KNR4 family protein [Hymenobacter sp.]|nr:MAG: SMI1/KNR4 family protein [Hymenobacter sp.]